MTRAALIAKLREAIRATSPEWNYSDYPVWLSHVEMERLIADLEFCAFAHKALEGGELPQTLKKQAG